jgi:hypothetical protein
MKDPSKFHLGSLENKLNRFPFALTISDTTEPDHPLIFINDAFRTMSGYGDEVLGTNCRFMQGDMANDAARAEIRIALQENRRAQVVVQNLRKNGDKFYNRLLVASVTTLGGDPNLAVGCQLDLGPNDPNYVVGIPAVDPEAAPGLFGKTPDQIRVEKRRLLTDAAIRLIQSWAALNEALPDG